MTDEQWLDALKEGHTVLQREFVMKHQGLIHSTISNMLGNTSDIEDIGQETFIRFFRHINNFRGDAKLSTYLTKIAINLSLNELKRRNRWRFFSIFQTDTPLALYERSEPLKDSESSELVRNALQHLDELSRAVIVLRLIEGYSSKETAETLGIPLGTVLSRLSRGQQKLKPILEHLMGGTP